MAAGDEQFTPEAALAVLGDGRRTLDLSDGDGEEEQISGRHTLMSFADGTPTAPTRQAAPPEARAARRLRLRRQRGRGRRPPGWRL